MTPSGILVGSLIGAFERVGSPFDMTQFRYALRDEVCVLWPGVASTFLLKMTPTAIVCGPHVVRMKEKEEGKGNKEQTSSRFTYTPPRMKEELMQCLLDASSSLCRDTSQVVLDYCGPHLEIEVSPNRKELIFTQLDAELQEMVYIKQRNPQVAHEMQRRGKKGTSPRVDCVNINRQQQVVCKDTNREGHNRITWTRKDCTSVSLSGLNYDQRILIDYLPPLETSSSSSPPPVLGQKRPR